MIKYKEHNGLTLACYAPTAERNDPLVNVSRGHIRDAEGNYVCRPFDRFYNLGEVPVDFTEGVVYEKLDGSMLNYWHHDGEWHFSTKFSFGDATTGWGNEFGAVCRKLIKPDWKFEPGWTYTFEFTSPENRVVHPYTEWKLWLLQRRNNATGVEEVDLEGFDNAPHYGVKTLTEVVQMASALDQFDEGYVVRGATGKVKVKNPAYLLLHKVRGAMGRKSIMELVASEEYTEYLAYFPEDFKALEPYIDAWTKVKVLARSYGWVKPLSRREVAEAVKNDPFKSMAFAVYDGRDPLDIPVGRKIKLMECVL